MITRESLEDMDIREGRQYMSQEEYNGVPGDNT
jgi:hypothetical protein